jgi:predicted dinucleotide-binding enzyme
MQLAATNLWMKSAQERASTRTKNKAKRDLSNVRQSNCVPYDMSRVTGYLNSQSHGSKQFFWIPNRSCSESFWPDTRKRPKSMIASFVRRFAFVLVIISPTMSALLSQTITVIGGGSVGSTLASAILQSGKVGKVLIAARDPAKTKAKLDEIGKSNLEVQDMNTAISAGDVLILAVPSAHSDEGLKNIVETLGDVSNKILIDATNPLSEFGDGLQIRWEQGISAGEFIQSLLPSTKVYKAFNTLGVEHMSDGTGKDMLFAGPDNGIANVIATIGFKPIYVGPIRYARNLEAMAELWIHCAIPPLPANYLGRDWTFKLAGNYNEE